MIIIMMIVVRVVELRSVNTVCRYLTAEEEEKEEAESQCSVVSSQYYLSSLPAPPGLVRSHCDCLYFPAWISARSPGRRFAGGYLL